MTKTASVSLTAVGQQVVYTIEVHNDGPGTAQGVVVVDALPAGMEFDSASTGCTASVMNGEEVVTCELGDLNDGQTVVVNIIANAIAAGRQVNHASVRHDVAEFVSSNNQSSVEVLVLADSDRDGTPDDYDGCPSDPLKTAPGVCGCGVAETDSDLDGIADCVDACPDSPPCAVVNATGCAIDSDADGVADGCDACPGTFAGDTVDSVGCSTQDDDNDGVLNDLDHCRGTPPCAVASVDANGCPQDADSDGLFDGCDNCPGADDLLDTDGDHIPDCLDACPLVGDTDSDGVQDCQDNCPDDPLKLDPGACGCGVTDADSDGDTIFDCIDVCPNNANGLKVDEFGRPLDDRNGDCLVSARESGGPPTPGSGQGTPTSLVNPACAPMMAPGFLMVACCLAGMRAARRRQW